MTALRFAIRLDAWFRPVLVLTFLRPARCYVELDERSVQVRMDWAFRAQLRRADVRAAARASSAPLAWGVHGLGGRWLVNGSLQGLVQLTLGDGARGRVLGVPVKLRELVVSLESPDELVAALAARR